MFPPLLAGDGVDTLILDGATLGYVDWELADSIVFNDVVDGTNTTPMSTILGGTGADTLDFNGTVQYATILGGTDAANP